MYGETGECKYSPELCLAALALALRSRVALFTSSGTAAYSHTRRERVQLRHGELPQQRILLPVQRGWKRQRVDLPVTTVDASHCDALTTAYGALTLLRGGRTEDICAGSLPLGGARGEHGRDGDVHSKRRALAGTVDGWDNGSGAG